MTIIVLTDENLKSLKSLLKPFCADTKSSHLTEAVARGLGFKSQAALLTAAKTSKKPKLDCVVFQEATFSAWLKDKGAAIVNRIPISAYNSLDQATFKWIESRSKADKANLTNAWFAKCRKHNLPYIYIEKKTKYCSVHWDYISVDEHHDPEKFTYDLSQKLERLIQKRSGAKGTFSLFVGSISGLSDLVEAVSR